MNLKEEIREEISKSEKRMFNAFKCHNKYGFLPICPNCGKLIFQIFKRKPKHYCNEICWRKFKTKQGYFAKKQKEFYKRWPEKYEKMRETSKFVALKKRKRKENLFCKVCGNLIKEIKKTTFCSPECQEIGRKRQMRAWNEKHKNSQLNLNKGGEDGR